MSKTMSRGPITIIRKQAHAEWRQPDDKAVSSTNAHVTSVVLGSCAEKRLSAREFECHVKTRSPKFRIDDGLEKDKQNTCSTEMSELARKHGSLGQ